LKQHAHSKIAPTARNRNGYGRLLGLLAMTFAGLVVLLGLAGSASAACPNDAFRTGPSAHLPDCRAYEQVSPTEKYGANIQHSQDNIFAALDGNALTFGDANGLPTTGGSSRPVIYDARRTADGWVTNGMRPATEPGFIGEINGWSQDLSRTLNTTNGNSGGALLLGDTAAGTWKTIVGSSPSTLTRVSETYVSQFAADDPERALFESGAVFAPGAIDNKNNLYEYNHGVVSLQGRIPVFPATSCDDEAGPACENPGEAYAGPFDWIYETFAFPGGARGGYYTPNAFSADGSRVFFTTAAGRLYMREDNTRTVQVSASQASTPDPNGEKPAVWVGATPDGSKVFFLSCQKLTDDSTAVSNAEPFCTKEGNGQDLYEYDVESEELTDLTVDHAAGDLLGADVIGFIGTSGDGSDVYFVANGVLAAGATPGTCTSTGGGGLNTGCSLYLLRDGTPVFVARLSPQGEPSDADNWLAVRPNGPSNSRTSRVSENGVVLFRTVQQLTSYENEGQAEIYRYAPGDSAPQCISCDPSGAAPLDDAGLFSVGNSATAEPKLKLMPRNLSADGKRIFFQTPDPLVPEDVNAEGGCPAVQAVPACTDVYMWEAEGTGSCESSAENGGCLSLLSTGTSAEGSFFGDASADGDNAFIFTTSPLVPQDDDELVDAYDARVGGGLDAQHPAPPAPPCEGEACRGAGSEVPPASGAGTAVFQGPGNPTPTFKKCKHGKVLKKGRCVRKKHKKHHKKHKKQAPKNGGSK
jgi:hypothetical protein